METTPKKPAISRTYLRMGLVALLAVAGVLAAAYAGGYVGGTGVKVDYTVQTGKWQTLSDECGNKPSMEVSGCIVNLVATIADSGEVGAAISVLREGMTVSSDLIGKCHNAAHGIGRTAVRLGGDLLEVYALPFPDCRFGLYHGALEEHTSGMSRNELIEDLNGLCAYFGQASSAATQECVHVLGHFVFDRSGDDIGKAVKDCTAFAEPTLHSRCVDGTLMQATDAARASVGKPRDLERSARIWGTDRKSQARLLTETCESMDVAEVKYVCYTNSSQTLSVLWDADYPRIHDYCDTSGNPQACYEGIAASGFTIYSWDPEQITAACYAGTGDGAEACISSMAFSYSIVSGKEGSRKVCGFVKNEHLETCTEARDRGLEIAGDIVSNQRTAREDYEVFNK